MTDHLADFSYLSLHKMKIPVFIHSYVTKNISHSEELKLYRSFAL